MLQEVAVRYPQERLYFLDKRRFRGLEISHGPCGRQFVLWDPEEHQEGEEQEPRIFVTKRNQPGPWRRWNGGTGVGRSGGKQCWR